MFLTGDFNAYSEEDPVQVLEAAGYTHLESGTAGEESYSFSGLWFARPRLRQRRGPRRRRRAWTSGTSTPASRSPTSTAANYNVTDFFDATLPFAASDHNPEIVGINAGRPDAPGRRADPRHERLPRPDLNNTTEAGAASSRVR